MVDDVRNKILFTILCLLIYRLGCGITIPFVNTAALQTMFGSTSVLDYYNLVSGGALSQCAVFAIGVSAYINASVFPRVNLRKMFLSYVWVFCSTSPGLQWVRLSTMNAYWR